MIAAYDRLFSDTSVKGPPARLTEGGHEAYKPLLREGLVVGRRAETQCFSENLFIDHSRDR